MWRSLLCFSCLLQSSIHSKIIYVDDSSSHAPLGCGLTLEACSTIYAGFLAANSGDTILLAPGSYSGYGNEGLTSENLTTTSLHLLGNGSQDTVTIHCQGEYRFLYSQRNFLESISNVTIKNCSAFGRFAVVNQDGGGLLVTDSSTQLTISDTTFQHNLGLNGGAISISTGSLNLIRCSFLDNQAGYRGGAIFSKDSGLKVFDSVFIGNQARGDIILSSKLIVDTSEAGKGGGIYANGGSRMTIHGSAFLANSAGIAGGALHIKLVLELDIDSCEFIKNSATGGQECNGNGLCAIQGGALFFVDLSSELRNCTFDSNTAITSDLSQVRQSLNHISLAISFRLVLTRWCINYCE